MSKTAKNWIFTSLHWVATFGSIVCFGQAVYILTGVSNVAPSPQWDVPHPDSYSAIAWLVLGVIVLIWLPLKLKMHRLALEEQRKIDDLEVIELDRPQVEGMK